MRIYLVRHGQSKFNALRIHQHGGIELSRYGQKQAKAVARRFRKIPIDVIISSDFMRAKQTAQAISQQIGKPIIFEKLLQERKRPTEMEGLRYDNPNTIKVKNLMRINSHDPYWHYSDEENFFDFINRIKKLVNFIEQRKEQNILLVSHGATITMLISFLIFKDRLTSEIFTQIIDFFKIRNTGITVCEKKNEEWKLITWNDQNHLR